MHIEVWRVVTKFHEEQWYWHFKAKNGRIVADAEAFTSKSNAVRAAKHVVGTIVKSVTGYKLLYTSKQKGDLTTITWI